jgi:hypothetical protein
MDYYEVGPYERSLGHLGYASEEDCRTLAYLLSLCFLAYDVMILFCHMLPSGCAKRGSNKEEEDLLSLTRTSRTIS